MTAKIEKARNAKSKARMDRPAFYQPGEDGHFYAIAYCPCVYSPARRDRTPAVAGLYWSPSAEFSRFSVHVFDVSDEHCLMYHRGPDYSDSIEAALLDFWQALPLPAYAWRLIERSHVKKFKLPEHKEPYWDARKRYCLALYGLRMRAHAAKAIPSMMGDQFQRSTKDLGIEKSLDPFLGPVGEEFIPDDAFAATKENEEFMQAAISACKD